MSSCYSKAPWWVGDGYAGCMCYECCRFKDEMRTPQEKGRKYEKDTAPGEITIPLSGAGRLKEDTKTEKYLRQKKLTTKASYSIKLEDLKKLEREALMVSRLPQFVLAFDTGGRLEEYVLLRKKDTDD
jgi:hypothetical protein